MHYPCTIFIHLHQSSIHCSHPPLSVVHALFSPTFISRPCTILTHLHQSSMHCSYPLSSVILALFSPTFISHPCTVLTHLHQSSMHRSLDPIEVLYEAEEGVGQLISLLGRPLLIDITQSRLAIRNAPGGSVVRWQQEESRPPVLERLKERHMRLQSLQRSIDK